MKIEKASANLEAEVIMRGLCAHCGACGTFCPHIEYLNDGLPHILDACNEIIGQCYNSCPRTTFDVNTIEKKMFGKSRSDEYLGYFEKSILVTSKKSILNALVETAFKNSIVDSFIVPKTLSKKPINNVPVTVTKPKDIPELNGINLNYTGPLITGVNAAYLEGYKSVGLVGNPCHFQGVAQMSHNDFRTGIKVQSIKISVMCAAGGATGCMYCIDYAGEFSDISYSDIKQEKDHAILLIRTPLGQKLVDQAIKDKKLELINEVPDLSNIQELAMKKKKRNIKNLLKLQNGKIGYLELNSDNLTALF